MHAMFSWANWLRLFGRKPTATLRNGRRVTPRKHAQDFADFGTAFGLDLSLSGDTAIKPTVEAATVKEIVKATPLAAATKAATPAR
jgi:hypothetical protein